VKRMEHVADRLEAWGDWCQRQRDGVPSKRGLVSSIYSFVRIRSVSIEASPFALHQALASIEAAQTDLLVRRLPQELRVAVLEAYVHGRYHTVARNARALRITRNCLHERLCRADMLLARWMVDEGSFDKNTLPCEHGYHRTPATP